MAAVEDGEQGSAALDWPTTPKGNVNTSSLDSGGASTGTDAATDQALALGNDAATAAEAAACASTSPIAKAAMTQQAAMKGLLGEVRLDLLVKELAAQSKAARSGDMEEMESMLAVQAQTLDTLFNHLTRRALQNMGQYTMAAEMYFKLAMRAQSQARSTALALFELKHPRAVSFVQQANFAHGPQQVNNGSAQSDSRVLQGNEAPIDSPVFAKRTFGEFL